MNIKMLDYFLGQIIDKIDEEVEALYFQRKAEEQKDNLKIEFINEMSLKPIKQQLNYLIEKSIYLCK